MQMCRMILIVLGMTIGAAPIVAQDYQQRVNYGQFLEPADRILHGAGQDAGAFFNYWTLMEEEEKPVVYMHYEGLSNIGSLWARSLKRDLKPFQDRMIVIQLGLELVGITQQIVTGAHDEDIDNWLNGVEELGLPVYARLGYEFNGFDWNRYEPDPYKAAFIYLTEKIRERDLEIATVWNYVPNPTQPSNFMAYYPGDAYVDWWSINYFEPAQLGNALSIAFLDSAAVHRRPVLIGESTPKDVGVLDGEADWDAWFEPFFDIIAQEPGIKMTGYINWDWGEYPQWSTWGDARLEQNFVVQQLFKDELDESLYAHAGTERAYRLLLGRDEVVAPARVEDVIVSGTSLPLKISWSASDDASGIARYLIMNKGEQVDFTGKTSVTVDAGVPGDTMRISVVAVDRAGNLGEQSSPVEVILEEPEGPVDLITNGQFDEGKTGWNLTEFVSNVSGIFEIDTTSVLEGANSAHITILQNSGTNWHLQLEQPLRVLKNHQYLVSYSLRASRETPAEVWLQKSEDPFTGYAQRNVMLNTQSQMFQDTAFLPVDDDVFMRFMLGTSGLSEIWVDDVSVLDLGVVTNTSLEDPIGIPVFMEISPPYPNPFRHAVHVELDLHEPGHVHIQVFDLLGRQVATLADAIHTQGAYTYMWEAGERPTGVYFVRVRYKEEIHTDQIVLVR